MRKKKILPNDDFGETKSIQLFEHEILNAVDNAWMEQLFAAKFDKYELD